MKKNVLMIVIIMVASGMILWILSARKASPLPTQSPTVSSLAKAMEISSSAFENNTPIPKQYTCDGSDVNPKISISHVPSAAKSLALILTDADVQGGDFVHWFVWNIPPTTTEINEGTIPSGAVVGKNDLGKKGYSGPCPPSGSHSYIFTLYGLDDTLKLGSEAPKIDVEKTIAGHNVSAASLVGTYSRR